MARKTRPEQPCINCKKPKAAAKAAAPVVMTVTLQGEMDRLWRHIVVGTTTCIMMIEQYQDVGMTGVPVDRLTELRDRLNAVLEKA